MKNSIRSTKLIGIILIIMLVFTTRVYAATDTFKTTLSVDNSQVKRGESVTVTMALSDIHIESGEKGIGAYTAKLDFDSSVLEYVSISGTDKWETPLYQDTLIASNTNDGEVVSEGQNIGSITFKVKDDANLGETTIKLTKFSGSTGASDVSAEDSSIKVQILNKDGGSDDPNGNGNESGNGSSGQGNGSGTSENGNGNGTGGIGTSEGGNGSQNGNGGSQNEKSGSYNTLSPYDDGKSNSKQGSLPYAGDEATTNVLMCTLVGACVIIAMIIMIRIKLLNKKIKKKRYTRKH